MLLRASAPFYISTTTILIEPFVIYCLNYLEAYKLVNLPLAPITSVYKILLCFFGAYKIHVKNPSLVCKAFHILAVVYPFIVSPLCPPPTHHLLPTHTHTHTTLRLQPHKDTQHSLKSKALQFIKLLLNIYYVPTTVLG